jgi:hypothetical protein
MPRLFATSFGSVVLQLLISVVIFFVFSSYSFSLSSVYETAAYIGYQYLSLAFGVVFRSLGWTVCIVAMSWFLACYGFFVVCFLSLPPLSLLIAAVSPPGLSH